MHGPASARETVAWPTTCHTNILGGSYDYQHFHYQRTHRNLATSQLSFWKHSEKLSPINSDNRGRGNILTIIRVLEVYIHILYTCTYL